MFTASLAALLRRDLSALAREVEAYPDEASLWTTSPGGLNSGGVLTRHICGNLQHYIGAHLGGSGYKRDRPAEFGAPAWPKQRLLAEIAATQRAVEDGLAKVSAEALAATFPEPVNGHPVQTADFLAHLAVHCGFHLGQVDFHRRLTSASTASIAPMATRALYSTPTASQAL